MPDPSLGRNSGVAHLDRPSLPRNGRPRRSTGSSKRARTSCSGTARALASWRTTADLPMPRPPQMNTGCRAATRRKALDMTDAFMQCPFAKEEMLAGGARSMRIFWSGAQSARWDRQSLRSELLADFIYLADQVGDGMIQRELCASPRSRMPMKRTRQSSPALLRATSKTVQKTGYRIRA
jgi:hypothetical protein